MSTMKEVEASVLRLPEKHRRRLADKLLASLPPREPSAHLSLFAGQRAGEAARAPVGAQAAWSRAMIVEEAGRRDQEIESGAVKP